MKTTRKTAAVTASTNRDSPKIDLAGVDAGAKMFVGLKGQAASAKAAAAQQTQTRICEPRARTNLSTKCISNRLRSSQSCEFELASEQRCVQRLARSQRPQPDHG